MTEAEDNDGLAAEYVLGTLEPGERRRVNVRRQADASLSAAIDAWERRLGLLNERRRGIEPPVHLLDSILSRITGQAPQSEGAEIVQLRRASGRRWPLVAGACALAASLVLAIIWSLPHLSLTQQARSELDCGKLYKNFWQTRDPESYARLSSEQLAGISRMALRAYDACQAGDEQDAKDVLARLLGRSGEISPHYGQHRAAVEPKERLAPRS